MSSTRDINNSYEVLFCFKICFVSKEPNFNFLFNFQREHMHNVQTHISKLTFAILSLPGDSHTSFAHLDLMQN